MLDRPNVRRPSSSPDGVGPSPADASGVRPSSSEAARPGTRAPGALLLGGKYVLESMLAVGGMSSVWRATHITLGRPVAVKFIDVKSQDRELTAERFLREARLAANIHHPNVIDVLDFGIAESGEATMVMELLEGESLSRRLDREPALTTREVVYVMSQVLSALEAVHHAGIVHCDMKPDNVVLGAPSDEGDVFAWLIDFGIAYSIDPASDLRRGRFGTDLHVITGTPEYMAPEQAEGRTDVDVRVDVYAASVMLYEMLSGRRPFAGEHPGRVLFHVIEGTHVPLAKLRPDLPELAAVVALGMSHDRARRPASARELRRLMLEAAHQYARRVGEATGDWPVSSSMGRASLAPTLSASAPALPAVRGRIAMMFVVLLGLAALVLGGWAWTSPSTRELAPRVVTAHAPRSATPTPAIYVPSDPLPAMAPIDPPTIAVAPPPVTADAPPPVARRLARRGRARVFQSRVAVPAAAYEEAPSPAPPTRGVIEFVDDPGF